MVIVHVFIKIKPDMIEPFKSATLKNAQNSIKEPGILRFDFVQQADDPLCFLLVEVYKDTNAVMLHKETSHYSESFKRAVIEEYLRTGCSKKILLANVGGKIFAMDGVCTHMGGHLWEGSLTGMTVKCPRHGSEFDLATGKNTKKPWIPFGKAPDLKTYPVSLEVEEVFVDV